ncbi:MAG TPA: hypothetical protein DD381_13260 [Lentisphaeria bacterium]|nr:MAG: hypothetical protein A2X47_11735 [Lentisphaerae bacterium GWF2_38_69]HBM17290.1 hypothetical protein [Lentisphaeria bacterium]
MDFNGLDFALKIRNVLLPVAFIIILFGWLWQVKNYTVNSSLSTMKNIVGTFMITALIMGYPTLLLKGTDAVYDASKEATVQVDQAMDTWSKASIEGENSTFNFTAKISKFFYNLGFGMSRILRKFLLSMQRCLEYVLIALSPLMIAFLKPEDTRPIGAKFLITSIGVMMWIIGLNIADLMMFQSWDLIAGLITFGGAAAGTASATFVAGSSVISGAIPLTIFGSIVTALFFLISTVLFYMLGPIIVMKLINGADPTQAVLNTVTKTAVMGAGSSALQKAIATGAFNLQKNITSAAGNAASGISNYVRNTLHGSGTNTFASTGSRKPNLDLRGNPVKPFTADKGNK